MKITAHIRHGQLDRKITGEGDTIAAALLSLTQNAYIPAGNPGFGKVCADLLADGKAAWGWVDYILTPSN